MIDHLWHLTETGYYLRQGGPYPPHTWRIESIVKHQHQKAAYCGIHYFDSDVYPEQYREKLYMGNIHGNCINCDYLERAGSTYFAKPDPDFLSANDSWFMPVVQKTGPDGCLYVLDWYDRYHCYQDANRDPEGIDRGKGRLYRIRYQDTPRAPAFDLAKETDAHLIERLHSPNVYFRDIAQRLLTERKTSREQLAALVLDDNAPRKARMHAIWALVGGGPLDAAVHLKLLRHSDPTFRAWGVRAAGNMQQVPLTVEGMIEALADDPSPDVRLQVAIAAPKLSEIDPLPILFKILATSGDDELLPHIVWNNLQPLMDDRADDVLASMQTSSAIGKPGMNCMMPYLVQRMLGGDRVDPKAVADLFDLLNVGEHADQALAQVFLRSVAIRLQNGELARQTVTELREDLGDAVHAILDGEASQFLYADAAFVSAAWHGVDGINATRKILADKARDPDLRARALEALVAARDQGLLRIVEDMLASQDEHAHELRRRTLAVLGRLEPPDVGRMVLSAYDNMEPDLRPAAIDLLTSRAAWAKQLLAAIKDHRVPREAVSVNHVRKLLASSDQELVDQATAEWGAMRLERSPEREQIIAQMRGVIRTTSGDAARGQAVFTKLCATCHKMYGEGQEVGPDITVNGRSSFEQLLSNVFDPSLVIGAAYQAVTVNTTDGRVLTGLLAENSDQRVVLKVQGGKTETIARADVDEMGVSKLSLMPEDVEKQLNSQEIADLFAYITLDRPPGDPNARQLPGVRLVEARDARDPAEFAGILAEVAPGFTTGASGEDGISLLSEYRGRATVVRTHPVSESQPCVLASDVELLAGKKSKLLLSVGCHDDGDWQLIVRANGEVLLDTTIGPDTTVEGWIELTVDLSKYAGQSVKLELLNAADDWNQEWGYWGRAAVVSE